MNYIVNIEKLINLIEHAKGKPHLLPTDILAAVQVSHTPGQDPIINFDIYE